MVMVAFKAEFGITKGAITGKRNLLWVEEYREMEVGNYLFLLPQKLVERSNVKVVCGAVGNETYDLN